MSSESSADLDGVELIRAERRRQELGLNYTAAHDEEHVEAELAGAGIAYATLARNQVVSGYDLTTAPPAQTWRWGADAWKPSADPIRNLVKAGALLAAEIDRIQRERAEVQS